MVNVDPLSGSEVACLATVTDSHDDLCIYVLQCTAFSRLSLYLPWNLELSSGY